MVPHVACICLNSVLRISHAAHSVRGCGETPTSSRRVPFWTLTIVLPIGKVGPHAVAWVGKFWNVSSGEGGDVMSRRHMPSAASQLCQAETLS